MFKSCTKCGGDNKYIYNAVIRYIESPYAKEEVEVTILSVPTFICSDCGNKYRLPYVDEKIEEKIISEYKRLSRDPEALSESMLKGDRYKISFDYSDL